MKKLMIATAMTLLCGSAYAQNTGPRPQTDTIQRPGTNNMERSSTSDSRLNARWNPREWATTTCPGPA